MNIIDTLADMMNIGFMWDWIAKFGGILILVATLVWILIIIGVAKNISQRTDAIWLQILCIIIATLWWPLWLLIYWIIRPNRTDEHHHFLDGIVCPSCETLNGDYPYCTQCGKLVKKKCKECWVMINPNFEYCWHCGAPNL